MTNLFDPITDVIDAFDQGKMVILLDDENRENEADLVQAAGSVTPADINFMIRYGRGLVCVALPPERVDQLELPMMPARGNDPMGTAFTTSVDAVDTHTGISAFERAHTISLLADPDTGADAFVTPGHIFCLKARRLGVLQRPGHTEAAVDLSRISGHDVPGGTICEIIADSGHMLRRDGAIEFARRYDLRIGTVKDLTQYRLKTETMVDADSVTRLPTPYGTFDLRSFVDRITGQCHLALTLPEPEADKKPLVRLHSECLTGDALHSLRCDCGSQLSSAMCEVSKHGCGAVIYLRQEGRGIGLKQKLRAYALQDQGMDTVDANLAQDLPADARNYAVAAHILKQIGFANIDLLTNNTSKKTGLLAYGITVASIKPLRGFETEHNRDYLQCKRDRLGHLL